jgi:hypothetical protein
MRSLTRVGLGLLCCTLTLGMAARSAGEDRKAEAERILEIMSLDARDCSLALSFPWGARDQGFKSHRLD